MLLRRNVLGSKKTQLQGEMVMAAVSGVRKTEGQ